MKVIRMAKLIVLGGALILIGLICWWFFGHHVQQTGRATRTKTGQEATVVVNGGYSPATIVLKKGIPAKVNFEMHDSTACLSHVVVEQLGIDKDLTKQPVTTITVPTDQAKEFNYACGMNMFHGKIIVK
ncbi:cupredoxin domain-containing protein [Ligilactobacillus hohenheimensis]|uniref:cupredoxin domain-containing protein n=1 Tax=Ligilactobacillus hohenheimensis TaxID=2991832 RepID=UPI0024BBCE5C|nr:cupredoxin domain-containing protein [Ligilactobacillus hohenheimensis]